MAEKEVRPSGLTMWGTHGTSLSSAKAIRVQGFEMKPGRIGNGAYFWTAVNDSKDCMELAHRLATTWAKKAQKRGQYRAESEIAVVEVNVTFQESEVLALDNPRMTFRLWSMLKRKLSELLELKEEDQWKSVTTGTLRQYEKEIHGFIELFVLELENNFKRKFKIIFKSQKCPDLSDPILEYIGNHSCFAIRDTSVISSMEITH